MFKRRHFPVEIILARVRWYCKYGISYRDLVEMMQEPGSEYGNGGLLLCGWESQMVHRMVSQIANQRFEDCGR